MGRTRIRRKQQTGGRPGTSPRSGVPGGAHNREFVRSDMLPDHRLPVCVKFAGVSNWGAGDRYERLPWRLYSLQLVLEGNGIAEINGEQHLAVPGDMLLIKPADFCRYYTGPAHRWQKTFMSILPEGAEGIIARLNLDAACHIRLAPTAFREARKRFRELVHVLRLKPRQFRERVSVLGYELLLIAAEAAPVPKQMDRYPVQVRAAMLYAEKHCDLPLTGAQLAAVAGCSRQHLSSAFSAHLGMGVHEWLTRLKMHHARSLLETTGGSVSYIASAAGYTDPFHFSRVFKRVTGVAPQQYREQFRAWRPEPDAADDRR